MRWFMAVLLATTVVLPATALTLVDKGESDYVIVVARDAIPAERFAAEELASHLEKMSGAKLTIASDEDALPARAILVGRSRFLDDLGVSVDWHALGKEGYLLRVAGAHLVIAGGRPRGTLYGVYALLEDYLGCRWFAPDTSVIPKSERIELPQLNLTEKPGFEYREPWMYVSWICSMWWKNHYDPDYISRTRHSGRIVNEMVGPVDERHGGYFEIPYCQHNLSLLVPAKEFAAENPEYFALQPDGTRTTEGDLELCLTHPDVVRIAAERLREWMRADPAADMFFIGQSDTIKNCQCDRCRAAYTRYDPEPDDPERRAGWGGLAGRNIEFVNAVAGLVEDEFPEKRIGTFAYGNTRNPPANIKAHRNVVVWYCPIERCACHPVDRGPINKGFYDFEAGIRRWQEIAREVYVYDYNKGDPFMLDIAPNVRALRRLGVRGVMVDAIMDIQVGFGFLRYWLWAQSLNKPQWDADTGLHEFLNAYYGAAAPHIDRYLRLVGDPHSYEPLAEETAGIWNETQVPPSSTEWRKSLWRNKDSPMRKELVHYCHLQMRRLTDDALEEGYARFEDALEVTADDARARRHVEAARISLQRAMFRLLPANDPRLRDEALEFLRVAKDMELDVVERKPIAEYREKLSEKIGMKLP